MWGAPVDVTSLGNDLRPAQRRRMWILGQIVRALDHLDLESVIAGTRRVEDFIIHGGSTEGGAAAVFRRSDADSGRAESASRTADWAERGDRALPAGHQRATAVAPPRGDSQGATPGRERRPVAPGGRTGAIVPLAPRNRALGNRSRGSSARRKLQEMDRATELRLQEEFLASRPPPTTTMDDVVRYLRQRGDIVVRDGDGYRVNYALRLTPAEMLLRANAKRGERGLPPFTVAVPSPGQASSPAASGSLALAPGSEEPLPAG
jgi:hypothetical protein